MIAHRSLRRSGRLLIAAGAFALLIAATGIVLHLVFRKGVYVGATGGYAPTWLILAGGVGIAATGIALLTYGVLRLSLSAPKRLPEGAVITLSR